MVKTVRVKSHKRKGLKKKAKVKSYKRKKRPKAKKRIVSKQKITYNIIRNEYGEFVGVRRVKRK